MAAKSPEEICRLFQMYLAEGDLEALLSIYDVEAVFLDQSGELKKGRQGLREVLTPLAAAKTNFDFRIIQIIQSDDIALMHTRWWHTSSPQPTAMNATAPTSSTSTAITVLLFTAPPHSPDFCSALHLASTALEGVSERDPNSRQAEPLLVGWQL